MTDRTELEPGLVDDFTMVTVTGDIAMRTISRYGNDIWKNTGTVQSISDEEYQEMVTKQQQTKAELNPITQQEWDDYLPEMVTAIQDGYLDKHLKVVAQELFKRRDIIDPDWKKRQQVNRETVHATTDDLNAGRRRTSADIEASDEALAALRQKLVGKTNPAITVPIDAVPTKMYEELKEVLRQTQLGDRVMVVDHIRMKGMPEPLVQSMLQEIEAEEVAGMHTSAGGTVLKTADEWCEQKGIQILDHDGWRGPNARSWKDFISEEEFDRRAAISTQMNVPAQPVQQPAAAKKRTIPGGRTAAKRVNWDGQYVIRSRKFAPVAWVDEDPRSASRTVTIGSKNYLRSDLIDTVFIMKEPWATKYNLKGVHCQIVGARTKVQLVFRTEPPKDSSYHKMWKSKEAAFFPGDVLSGILG